MTLSPIGLPGRAVCPGLPPVALRRAVPLQENLGYIVIQGGIGA
jgi:hypothetical protein